MSSGLLFGLDLAEGKDKPPEYPRKEHDTKVKTVILCLRLTQSLPGSSGLFVMDNGVCVLQALVDLRNTGVFRSALINNQCYWPIFAKYENIRAHVNGKEPGYFDAIRGELKTTVLNIRN